MKLIAYCGLFYSECSIYLVGMEPDHDKKEKIIDENNSVVQNSL